MNPYQHTHTHSLAHHLFSVNTPPPLLPPHSYLKNFHLSFLVKFFFFWCSFLCILFSFSIYLYKKQQQQQQNPTILENFICLLTHLKFLCVSNNLRFSTRNRRESKTLELFFILMFFFLNSRKNKFFKIASER
jgi:hypothetical protein